MMEWLRCRLGLGDGCEPRYDPDADETVRRLYAYAAKANHERHEIRSARLRGEPPVMVGGAKRPDLASALLAAHRRSEERDQ